MRRDYCNRKNTVLIRSSRELGKKSVFYREVKKARKNQVREVG